MRGADVRHLRPGHLPSETLPEGPDLPSEDLRAEDVLRAGHLLDLRAEGLRSGGRHERDSGSGRRAAGSGSKDDLTRP